MITRRLLAACAALAGCGLLPGDDVIDFDALAARFDESAQVEQRIPLAELLHGFSADLACQLGPGVAATGTGRAALDQRLVNMQALPVGEEEVLLLFLDSAASAFALQHAPTGGADVAPRLAPCAAAAGACMPAAAGELRLWREDGRVAFQLCPAGAPSDRAG